MLESLLNKGARLKRSGTLLKRDFTEVFPYEICKIFKNTFCTKYKTFLILSFKDILNHFFM